MGSVSLLNLAFLLFLLILYHNILATSKSIYTPTENILVACGSTFGGVSLDNRRWEGDQSKYSVLTTARSVPVPASVKGSSLWTAPYLAARISRSPFMYTLPVSTPGQKFIRLHFYPTNYGEYSRGKDFLDVKVGNYTLLSNFSASSFADRWQVATFFREYCVNVEENENELKVRFAPFLDDSNDSSYAFINGIEIVSMPTNLYYTAPDGLSRNFSVRNSTVLEMIYRLNVGGQTISPVYDTGMFRQWKDDEIYFYSMLSFIPRYPGSSLNYSKTRPYTAPDDIYLSDRELTNNHTYNLMNNLTWRVEVDVGFEYLIRLHFCENDPEVTAVNYRRFIIFIDEKTVDAAFDVLELSGGRRIPIYKDYVIKVESKGHEPRRVMLISLHPNPSSLYKNAILNGIEVFKLSNSEGSLAGPNYVAPAPSESPQLSMPPSNRSNNPKKTLLIAVGVNIVTFFIVLSLIFCLVILLIKERKIFPACCFWLNKGKSSATDPKAAPFPDKQCCRHFSLTDIKTATNDFDENMIIGVGGFGNVYEGIIQGVDMTVAVKRLDPKSDQGTHEFITEIEMLSQVRHAHLVSLIGCCYEGGEMILVYEYMSNGTLRDHLYGKNMDPLPWKQRLEICIGAASGFHYLHAELTNKIIHRDVKSSNILLDENWIAKVSDFGLSKIGLKNCEVSTMVKGTFGYLDPEYARSGHLTEKSDVYSFGAVLIEVLCARKPVDQKLEEDQWNLAHWAHKCIRNGTIYQIIDPCLIGKIAPACFYKFVEVAESCLQDVGKDRPTMREVMDKLQSALELQEAADAKVEKMNPDSKIFYSEELFSTHPSVRIIGSPTLGPVSSSLDTKTTISSMSDYFESGPSTGVKSSNAFSTTNNSTT